MTVWQEVLFVAFFISLPFLYDTRRTFRYHFRLATFFVLAAVTSLLAVVQFKHRNRSTPLLLPPPRPVLLSLFHSLTPCASDGCPGIRRISHLEKQIRTVYRYSTPLFPNLR